MNNCAENSKRFKETIIKPKVLTFSAGSVKLRSILMSAITQGNGDDIRLFFYDYLVGISLKSGERESRGYNDVQFSITGPREKRHTNLR